MDWFHLVCFICDPKISGQKINSTHEGKKKAKGGSGKKEFKPYHATSVPKAGTSRKGLLGHGRPRVAVGGQVTDLLANEANGPATTAMLRNIPNRLSQALRALCGLRRHMMLEGIC